MAFGKKTAEDTMSEELDPDGFSSTQTALGFCALGLLGILFLTPVLSGGAQIVSNELTGGIDRTVTGSIGKTDNTLRYTIRQSVMQSDPSVPCIIFEDGSQQGGC